MVWDYKNNGTALVILAVVTLLNIGLAINFVSANGRALAAVFSGQSIFLLAGFELVTVLATYVVTKHRSFSLPVQTRRLNSR